MDSDAFKTPEHPIETQTDPPRALSLSPVGSSISTKSASETSLALVALGIRNAGFKRLRQLGISTVDALTAFSANELLETGKLNEAQVADVIECLALYGKSLQKEPSSPAASRVGLPVMRSARIIEPPVALHASKPVSAFLPVPDRSVGSELEVEAQEIAAAFAARDPFSDLSKKRSKTLAKTGRPRLTDNERARKKAEGQPKRPSGSPRLDNPDDINRIERLRQTITMDAVDTAWLYGVSRDVIYGMCRRGAIRHQRCGDRFVIVTDAVFADLFPTTNGAPPTIEHASARRGS